MGIVSSIKYNVRIIKHVARMALVGPAFMFLGVAGPAGGGINPAFLEKAEKARLNDLAAGKNIADHLTTWKEGGAIADFRAVETAVIAVRDKYPEHKSLARETLSVIRKNEADRAQAAPEVKPPFEEKAPEPEKGKMPARPLRGAAPPPPPLTGMFEDVIPARDWQEAFTWLIEIAKQPNQPKELSAVAFIADRANSKKGFDPKDNHELASAYENVVSIYLDRIKSNIPPELKLKYVQGIVALFDADVPTRKRDKMLSEALCTEYPDIIIAALETVDYSLAFDLTDEVIALAKLPQNLKELQSRPAHLEIIAAARAALTGLSRMRNDANPNIKAIRKSSEKVFKQLEKLGPTPTQEDFDRQMVKLAQEFIKEYQKFIEKQTANGIQARTYVFRQKDGFKSNFEKLELYLRQLAEIQDIHTEPAQRLLRHVWRQALAEKILAQTDEMQRLVEIAIAAEELEGKGAARLAELVSIIAPQKKIISKEIELEIRVLFALKNPEGEKESKLLATAEAKEILNKISGDTENPLANAALEQLGKMPAEEVEQEIAGISSQELNDLRRELRDAKNLAAAREQINQLLVEEIGEAMRGASDAKRAGPDLDPSLEAAVRSDRVEERRDPEIVKLVLRLRAAEEARETADARFSLAETAATTLKAQLEGARSALADAKTEGQKTTVVDMAKVVGEEISRASVARFVAARNKISEEQEALGRQKDTLADERSQKELELDGARQYLEMLTGNFEIAAQHILDRAINTEGTLALLRNKRDEEVNNARETFVAELSTKGLFGSRLDKEKRAVLDGTTKLPQVDEIFKHYDRRINSLLQQSADEFSVDISGKNPEDALAVIQAAAQKAAEAKRAEAKGAYPERDAEIASLSKEIERRQAEIGGIDQMIVSLTENLSALDQKAGELEAARQTVEEASRALEEALNALLGNSTKEK